MRIISFQQEGKDNRLKAIRKLISCGNVEGDWIIVDYKEFLDIFDIRNKYTIRRKLIELGYIVRLDYLGNLHIKNTKIDVEKNEDDLKELEDDLKELEDEIAIYGNVKIIAEGEKINIDRFCDEIDIKNFLIKVTKIERKEDSKPIGEYESFYKLVGEGETDERLDIATELLKELIIVTKNGFEQLKLSFDKVEKELETLEVVTKDGFDRIEKR